MIFAALTYISAVIHHQKIFQFKRNRDISLNTFLNLNAQIAVDQTIRQRTDHLKALFPVPAHVNYQPFQNVRFMT